MRVTLDEKEIVRSYKNAVCRAEQVRILSELNDCGQKEIVEVLRRHGFPVKAYKPKGFAERCAALLRRLVTEGKTDSEIAATVGMHRTTIKLWRERSGLARGEGGQRR